MSVKWNIFTNIFSSNLPSSSLHIETKEGGGGACVCVCVCAYGASRVGDLVCVAVGSSPSSNSSHMLSIVSVSHISDHFHME